MKQLVYPDLSTTDKISWCLKFAENTFSALNYGFADCATKAWELAQFKHPNYNVPTDVSVPLWFSYFATLNGVYKDWGHVVTSVPGRGLFSSPWSINQVTPENVETGVGSTWFKDIAECERILGCKYVGWSEDIANVRVVEGVVMPNDGDVDNAYLTANGRVATQEEKDAYTKIGWSDPTGLLYGKIYVDWKNTQQALKDAQDKPDSKFKVYVPPTLYEETT